MFFISSININVVSEPPDFKCFLCIPAFAADAAAVNPTQLK